VPRPHALAEHPLGPGRCICRFRSDTKASLSAVFRGLNLYLGNYIGEFLGEACLAVFFLLSGLSLIEEARFPKWLGWAGIFFAVLFLVGAFRNALPAVQVVADANNVLLPLWMIVLGVSLIRQSRKARAHDPRDRKSVN
jgi:hypothetical protein